MKNILGTLFVVATPIGNLSDITLRALEVLKTVDLIACEDTRHTGVMLKHLGIEKPLISYFQHSKLSKIEYIIEQLLNGKNIALVTDAGTPGISDPGQALIRRIKELSITNYQLPVNNQLKNDQYFNGVIPAKAGIQESYLKNNSEGEEKFFEKISRQVRDDNSIRVIPIPGPSALTAAASVSGMIEKEFYFAGFLPKKKGRQTEFKKLSKLDVPVIIYESAMRLERTLEDIGTYFGEDTEVFIAREITKMFEEYWGGSIREVIDHLGEHQLRGEMVLIVKKTE